jgi:predicted phosphodiesterase
MRFFVFADSHLNTRPDPEFLDWVKFWTDKVDKVIICGDFWDSYFCTLDEFVDSTWKENLFPLLKSKKTVYLYGNHDRKQDNGIKAETFSDQQLEKLDLKIGDRNFHFEHGHKLIPTVDTNINWLGRLGNYIQNTLSKIFGKAFFNVFSPETLLIEEVWRKKESFLVCGHVHFTRTGKNYHVLGPSNFKHMSGLIIEDDGQLTSQTYV